MNQLHQAPLFAQLIVRYRLFAAAALLVLAATAIWRIPHLHSEAFPDLSNVQVSVSTAAPGFATEEIEQLVTIPLEMRLNALPAVSQLRSTSQTGLSQITVVFNDSISRDDARQLVKDQIQTAASIIPEEAQLPQLSADTGAMGEVFHYALVSETASYRELDELNKQLVSRLLLPIDGVSDIRTIGGTEAQYQVRLNSDKLATYSLSVSDVISALQNDNLNIGGGFITEGSTRYTLRGIGRVEGGIKGISQLGDITVSWQDGHAITVNDLATVELAASQANSIATFTKASDKVSQQVVSGAVRLQSGANASITLNQIRELLPTIQASLPDNVRLETIYNQRELIDDIVYTLLSALFLATGLIAIVLVLFLVQIRASLLILISIPVSICITLIIFERIGAATNLMSLGGLTIAIVTLVDGSIVVMDAVVRKLQFSPSANPRHIVAKALAEVASPVIFGAFVVSAMFLPLLTLSGLGGKLFSPLALAVVLAELSALVTALWILPSLAAIAFRRPIKTRRNPPIQALIQRYRRLLEFVIGRRWAVIAFVGVFFLAAIFTPRVGSEFIPELEEGTLTVGVTLPEKTSLEQAAALTAQLEQVLLAFPEVKYSASQILTGPAQGINLDILLALHDTREWVSAQDRITLTTLMGRKLDQFDGVQYAFSQPIAAGVDEMLSGTKAQIAVKLFGPDLAELASLSQQAGKIISRVPGTVGITAEEVTNEPRVTIIPRRDKLAENGISVSQVMQIINQSLSGHIIGQVIDNTQRFDIQVSLKVGEAQSILDIYALGMKNAEGQWVTLDTLVDISIGDGPAWIKHDGGERRMVIGVNARSRDLSGLVASLNSTLTDKLQLPPGYRFEISGEHQDQQQSLVRLAWAGAIAGLVILLILRSTLGGFRQALLVMGVAPLAGLGGHFALVISGLPLSVPAVIGYLAVAGLSVLNGVVLIDAINKKREAGCTPYDAIIDGAAGRLRPVLITAITAIVGLLPLMLAEGPGAELQRPLATVMIGGLISATLLTLVVLPAHYKWSSKTREAKAVRQSLDVEGF